MFTFFLPAISFITFMIMVVASVITIRNYMRERQEKAEKKEGRVPTTKVGNGKIVVGKERKDWDEV